MDAQENIVTVFIVAAVLLGKDLLLKLWNKFWKKAVDTDYIPASEAARFRLLDECLHERGLCAARRSAEEKAMAEFSSAIVAEVKGLRSDIRRLDARVIKHLVHSGAPSKVIDDAIDTSIGGTD